MKIQASRLFDFALLAATKAGVEVKPFIDYCNSNFEKIVRSLAGELTLQDNVKGQIITVSVSHGIAQSVSVNSKSIVGVVPLASSTSSIAAFNWQLNSKGDLQFTVSFQVDPLKAVSCKFFAHFE